MCTYQKENGKAPCCTHDCDGCVWNQTSKNEEEKINEVNTMDCREPKCRRHDMILVDYRGIEIVRCSKCGHKYPRDIPWCEECGSSKTEKIEYEER